MKAAVWGLGKHAINNILPALSKSSDIDLLGVYTRDESIKKACGKDFNCKTWKDEDSMLSDTEIDIVYLSTPPGLHYESGIDILSAGKHFWCEKPFTTNLDHTEHIIKISEENKLTIAEGFMYLHHPQFLSLKKELRKYSPGEIKLINSTFTLPHSQTPGFRYNPDLGGSTLLDIGTYPISIVLDLLEENNPQIVFNKSYIDKDKNIDMSGCTVLEFPSGTICNLFWGMGFGYKNEIAILTTKGSLYSDKIFSKKEEFIPKIILRNNVGEVSNIEINASNHFISMFDHFRSLIQNADKAATERKKILNLARITEAIKNG